ncbi:uncharacterized protein LOC142220037 [Haematobia irritans]|uniref:uncharacterized protein LOC142220037 n=1 Tax=Haematobia irritans TaxID=7368 RepID=UPI003F505EEB
MICRHQSLILYILILYSSYEISHANVVFRFGFDFGSNAEETSLKTSLQIGEESHNYTIGTPKEEFTTNAPVLVDIWTQQARLNTTANDKLVLTQTSINQLKNDLSGVVGRSDYIAGQIKLMTRYLNKVNIALETPGVNRFNILQDFVQLVDELRIPPGEDVGGERSLDYTVMKMAVEKHKLVDLQTQIVVDVLQAIETWQEYVKTKMIDISTV